MAISDTAGPYGRGLVALHDCEPNDLLLAVPLEVVLQEEADDTTEEDTVGLPWSVRMAVTILSGAI